ncbi:MAG: cobalamin biosynthesis bifunctional protein CbiET, partial [Nakamurella sp.]
MNCTSAQPVDGPGPRVTVVGIGADGWAGLSEQARELILAAPLVVAGHRQQTLLPDIEGQDRRRWPTPMLPS